MANILQRIYSSIVPSSAQPIGFSQKQNDKNLRSYVSRVQLERLRYDVSMWRDAVKEMENAWYPQRVKVQRMYLDTTLNGHVFACIKKRKQLSLLREWNFENENGDKNEDLKKLFNKKWFASFIEYALDARFFGYTLVKLDDLVGDQFPNIGIVQRQNISPDRLNVASLVYSIAGAQFMDEPYADWHVWIPTNTEIGISNCGYGLLYNVALYEIICRNLLGANADATELYGSPTRVGTTSKTEESERAEFAQALADMGSSGWILKDTMDELELLESKGNGQGFKLYGDLEKRCEDKISKIFFGHADALDSTPGKLGGTQGEESPAAKALKDTQAEDGAFLEDVVNSVLIPKLLKLGFQIDPSFKFCFSNNQEKIDERVNEDLNNKATADIAYVMKQAGLEMDAAYFTERTGIPATKVEALTLPPSQFSNRIKNKLEQLYK